MCLTISVYITITTKCIIDLTSQNLNITYIMDNSDHANTVHFKDCFISNLQY